MTARCDLKCDCFKRNFPHFGLEYKDSDFSKGERDSLAGVHAIFSRIFLLKKMTVSRHG